eukprot:3607540-Pleurochrysis_carterae.AAC.1
MALQAILILYRDLPRLSTIRVGGGMVISVGYQRPLVGSGAGAGAGAQSTYGAVRRRVLSGQRQPW